MKRTLAFETLKNIGKEVLLKGWVKTRRDHGKLIFLDLRDRSGTVQIVISPQISQEAYKIGQELRAEDAILLIGSIKKRPEAMINLELPTGTIEIEAQKLEILARAEELPFDLGSPTLSLNIETLLDHRSLSLRHPKIMAIFKVQETIVQSFRQTLKDLDFVEIQVPTIVASSTEGGAEVFRIKYYDYDAYLAQSPQLYKQILVTAFERVFTLAHAYRAEPSVTTRHLTEYIGLDAEMGFIENFEEIMAVVEQVFANFFKNLEEKNQGELKLYQVSLPKMGKIPRLKLKEAQEIIFKQTGRDCRQEPDLSPEDEREICRWMRETHQQEMVFITHYPTKKRPFYTHPDPKDPEFTLSFDLLGKGIEWVTGSQRISDYKKLLENVKKWGNKPQDFETYLEAFRYGMPPEGGFCIGLERLTASILGITNLREASLFPRDMERIDQRLSVLQSAKSEK